MRNTLLILTVLLLFVGCTTPPAVDDAIRSSSPGSGSASAGNKDMSITPAIATAWGASSSTASPTTAGYNPDHSNAGSGHLATGFVIAANPAVLMMLAERLANDPVLLSIAEEMATITGREDPVEGDQERLDALRVMFSNRSEQLDDSAKGLSGDLSSLCNLVVMNFIRANVGHDERAPTPEESKSMALLLPNVINAAKGLEQNIEDGN